MALSIMNNTTALGAMTSVNKANSKLATTIKQLSTGFRINSAADDASGLAVSEKLRGQISGLSKAASNSQDAISMLQTAEAAMGTMTDIVQRMRELAVQAGDPAYTTNDRAMLQLEVDQLKQEINRVSTSTEFNTKKLLNGDAAALWSATSGDIEAIVRGTPTAGNYKIETKIAGGTNNVYKSDVMTLNEGTQSAYEYKEGNASVVGVKSISNINGMAETKSSTDTSDVRLVSIGTNRSTTASDSAVVIMSRYASDIGTGSLSTIMTTDIANTAFSSGVFEIEAMQTRAANGSAKMQVRYMDGATGYVSNWQEFTIGTGGTHAAAITINGKDIAASTFTVAADATFNKGDKVLLGFSQDRATNANDTTSVDFTINTGGGATAITNATQIVSSAGYTIRVANAVDPNNDITTTLYTAQMDVKTGKVYYGSMDVTLKRADSAPIAAVGTSASGTAINIVDSGVASKWTKLSEISRFVNADGRNILENTQELTIYGGNGKQATVYVEGSDTIADFEKKLTDAIVDQLGLGGKEAKVNNNLVNYVNKGSGTGGNEAVEGTFIIQTAMLGGDSALSFVGDQGLIDALSLSQIKEAQDPSMSIRVSDAHTGEFIGEDTVTDGILRGVIGGVDVKVDPRSAVDVEWDDTGKFMKFKPQATASTAYLHVADNSTRAAIGANEGQTLDISIGQLDVTSLELDDVNVVTFNNAQKSITRLDQALERISKARAVAGAQINRLDYTINNLNTARENLTASESRIRDLDIAEASSALAARQVLLQSATAMLAQANQLPSYAAQLLR